MTAFQLAGWRPILTAFTLWAAHFLLCWAAAEIWPHEGRANMLGWGFTAMALLAMGFHFVRLRASKPAGEMSAWGHRFAHGAIAIATAAIVFTALPSLVFVP